MNHIINEDLQYLFLNSKLDWDRFRNKTVLVSGTYGMLPSYMVFMLIYLNENNVPVNIIALGRNREKARECFGHYMDKHYFTFLEMDVCDPLNVDCKIDFIVHAASPASSQYYSVNPVGVLKPNVLGTYNLLELAKKHQCESFLYFSSGEIYGKMESEQIVETDSGYLNPMDIRSCYAESKRLGETMCISYHHQFDIPVKVIRCAHIYGPTMDLKNDSRVFSQFVSNIVSSQNIEMKSDGEAIRSFCYISDANDAFFRILLNGVSGEAYNIANPAGRISIKDLALLLVSLYPEKKLTVTIQKQNENYVENTHKRHPQFNVDKLRSLGWSPQFDIEEGFKRTIKSFII